jgi:hypothetical protein
MDAALGGRGIVKGRIFLALLDRSTLSSTGRGRRNLLKFVARKSQFMNWFFPATVSRLFGC